MKNFLCALLLQWLSGYGLVTHAADEVYAFTADDGSVNLSNVPEDERYQVLIAGQNNTPPAAPLATSPASVVAVQKPGNLLVDRIRYKRIVDDVASRYGLDSALLHAVISVESRYDPTVVSRTGAIGLMQLMPATARRYGVTDSFDAEQNLHGGAKYLRDLLLMFNNDVSLALAAYNAGESAVVKYGNRIPPNRETRKYVPKVLGYYRKYRREL